MRPQLALLVPLALAACATTPATDDGIVRTGLNQRIHVEGPYVTPLAVLEDSRCPSDVQCISAGRLRISARIELGSGSETRELIQGEPVQLADGTLELFEVLPYAKADEPVAAEDYRFGFTFTGGI